MALKRRFVNHWFRLGVTVLRMAGCVAQNPVLLTSDYIYCFPWICQAYRRVTGGYTHLKGRMAPRVTLYYRRTHSLHSVCKLVLEQRFSPR